MSSTVSKYKIVYDGGDGYTHEKYIYCKFENVWDGQLWRNEDGTPVDFFCLSDSEALVTAHCIANIPTNNEHYYWKEIKDFVLPDIVWESFKLYKRKEDNGENGNENT